MEGRWGDKGSKSGVSPHIRRPTINLQEDYWEVCTKRTNKIRRGCHPGGTIPEHGRLGCMDDPKPDGWGKCQTCGLLGMLSWSNQHHGNRFLFEISDQGREKGAIFESRMGAAGGGTASCDPVCIVRQASVWDEITAIGREKKIAEIHGNKDIALQVIGHNRACPRWIRYQPGLSPQWHYAKQVMDRIFTQMDIDNNRRDREQRVQFWIMGGMVFAQVLMGLAALVVAIIGVLLVLWLR